MTDRCEPPEHLRDVDGWHWVMGCDGVALAMRWVSGADGYCWFSTRHFSIKEATELGWRYLAPVPSPEAVRALVEAAKTLIETSYQDPKGPFFVGEDEICALNSALAPFAEPGT